MGSNIPVFVTVILVIEDCESPMCDRVICNTTRVKQAFKHNFFKTLYRNLPATVECPAGDAEPYGGGVLAL